MTKLLGLVLFDGVFRPTRNNREAVLTVRVYAYTEVSARAMAGAQEEVADLFQRAGVRIAWQGCRSASEPREDPACGPNAGTAEVLVRIVEKPLAGGGYGNEALGRAIPPLYATVYGHAIVEVSKAVTAGPGQILGLAIAHELGHLLLGPDSHCPVGIMRAVWSRQDFEDASQRALRFTAQQMRQIERRSRGPSSITS